MSRLAAMVAFLVAPLAACQTGPSRRESMEHFQQTIPSCSSSDECEVKWAAAFRFVQENCAFRIKQYDDHFIQTYQSGDYANTNLACEVVKEPQGRGVYRIIAKFWINNAFMNGAPAKMVEFNDYVSLAYRN